MRIVGLDARLRPGLASLAVDGGSPEQFQFGIRRIAGMAWKATRKPRPYVATIFISTPRSAERSDRSRRRIPVTSFWTDSNPMPDLQDWSVDNLPSNP